MKAGFRGWLYRWVSALLGLLGICAFLTVGEVSRFYGFPKLAVWGWGGLALSFLLMMTSFFGVWFWKRYLAFTAVVGILLSLGYLAFRPEVFRDDVLKQLRTPPLSFDLWVYRGIVLKDDPERELKIERLGFAYGMLRSYGNRDRTPVLPTPEPSAMSFSGSGQ